MGAVIKPIGMLKSYIDNQPETRCAAGISVRQALQALGIPPDLVALVMVNDTVQDKDYLVQDGDLIQIMAIIGGGSLGADASGPFSAGC